MASERIRQPVRILIICQELISIVYQIQVNYKIVAGHRKLMQNPVCDCLVRNVCYRQNPGNIACIRSLYQVCLLYTSHEYLQVI